jgi:hypothetical protein
MNSMKTMMKTAFLTVIGIMIMAGSAQAASFYTTAAPGPNQTGVVVDLWLQNDGGETGFFNYAWEVTAVGDITITAWIPDNGSPSAVTASNISGTKGAVGDTAGPIHIGNFTVDTGSSAFSLWASSNGQNVVEMAGFVSSQISSTLIFATPEPSTILLMGMGLTGLAAMRRRL